MLSECFFLTQATHALIKIVQSAVYRRTFSEASWCLWMFVKKEAHLGVGVDLFHKECALAFFLRVDHIYVIPDKK